MYLSTVGVKCPNCGVKFNSRQVPVHYDSGKRNSELRQDFQGQYEQFEPYAVCTCPSCGRADWIDHFEPTSEEAVLNQPASTPHLQYRSAAVGAERGGSTFYNIALLYLHAAWCADDARAHPQAREYRRLAADAFAKSLIDISCPIEKRPEIEYLIGELLRRSGDFEAAKKHLRDVIPALPARFAFMARKLMKLCELGNIESIQFEA
jgi:uncharacterized protein (DUF2225 family)